MPSLSSNIALKIGVLGLLKPSLFFEDMGVSKNRGTPKWMVYNGKPIKIDDLGVTLFLETPHILPIFRGELAVGFREVIFYVFFPNHVNNQANLKSPFKNHQQFGSVRCVSDLFFPKHLRNKQVAKIEVNKNCHFWRVFSPTETSQTNLPTVPSSSKEGAVGSKFTDYRRIRSCGMGWLLLLFLRSWWSSFCWDAQEVVMGAPIPCMVYIYIYYLHEWLVFNGKIW